MKIEKLIQITLTDKEIQEAILDYISKTAPKKHYDHMKNNAFMIDCKDGEFIICIDGTMPEEC
jgi:hypothetical protein